MSPILSLFVGMKVTPRKEDEFWGHGGRRHLELDLIAKRHGAADLARQADSFLHPAQVADIVKEIETN